MEFKVKDTRIKISFSFFALILLFTSTEKNKVLIYTLFFSFLHELVHIFFISLFCGLPEKITISIFGASITKKEKTDSYLKEIIINLSAPVFNILLAVVLFLFSEKGSNLLKSYSETNLLLGCFNLLPFYNFDGGKALSNDHNPKKDCCMF